MEAAASMDPGLKWSDRHLLGYAPMDAHHRTFVASLNALGAARPADLPAALDCFIADTETHFREENECMTQHDFPPRDCHIREHQAVLDTLYEARRLVAVGNTGFLPGLLVALAEWFPGHLDHLDSALAHWMSKKKFGGAPVVLKRAAV